MQQTMHNNNNTGLNYISMFIELAIKNYVM